MKKITKNMKNKIVTLKEFKINAEHNNSNIDQQIVGNLLKDRFNAKDDIAEIVVSIYKMIFTTDIKKVLSSLRDSHIGLTREEVESAIVYLNKAYYIAYFQSKQSGEGLISSVIESLRNYECHGKNCDCSVHSLNVTYHVN
ncbi:MAG: hypothetical protein QG567_1282 [Campylobacterota bacterium]|nr:hypothetical protein [Campylobacterota bacterium]